jgi:zinc protease
MKKSNILDIAPISKETPQFKFPDFEIDHLDSGIEVYLFQDKTQALFDFKIIFHRGAYDEKKPGSSLCASNLFLKGTKSEKAQEIAQKFDLIGASVSSSARWDDTVVNINVIEDKINPAIDLLAECIFNSNFHQDEIDRQKQKQIATITHEIANAAYLSQIAFNSV